MAGKRVVWLVVAILAAYLALIGYWAVYLIGQRQGTLKLLGIAVVVISLIGIGLVAAEIRFGQQTERLARILNDEGDPGDPPLSRSPGGRVDRAAADELFEQRKAEVEADTQNWRGWYRLAIAYDLAGDRRRARHAMRAAISLSQQP